jgi:hypothetical protein
MEVTFPVAVTILIRWGLRTHSTQLYVHNSSRILQAL